MKIGVFGCGAYGMALSDILANNNHKVTMWTKFEEEMNSLKTTRKNEKVLPGYILNDNIDITTDMKKVIEESELLVMAIPMAFLESTVIEMKPYIKNNNIVIGTKGIEKSGLTAHEIIKKHLDTDNIGVLSGPSFAIDIVSKNVLGLTVATASKQTKELVEKTFSNNYINLEYISDIAGTEICGAIKNVAAIGMGILTGLHTNESTQAMMLKRLIEDIRTLLDKLGSNKDTFLAYAGIGDFYLTCTSTKSRNFSFGKLLGEKNKEEVKTYLENTTVEGVYTAKSIHSVLKDKNISLPIIDTIYEIIFNEEDPLKLLTVLVEKK
ncbi:MAG: NAD(P)H-dependent glycerol-3-phosphate dehydrogenase [Firmicutes bacterium]|nr:NAD(P)H-dependent glycerol-3-phosphate dehydrogenase [Bacillota bacterium]